MMRVIAGISSLAACVALQRNEFEFDQLLTMKHPEVDHTCRGGMHAVHPSFTFKPNSSFLVVAFKGLCIQMHGRRASWHSSLMLGQVHLQGFRNESRSSMDWNSLEIAPDPRFDGKAGKAECMFPAMDQMSGLEDTRLVRTGDGVYAVMSGFKVVDTDEEGERPSCGMYGIVLHAAKVESVAPPRLGKPTLLTYPGMGKIERPWAMFVTPDLTGAQVRVVHEIYPHTIVKADLQAGSALFEHHTFSRAVERMARVYRTRPGNFHGGAAVARVKTDAGDYFMSIMHTKVKKDGQYVFLSFPYKFSFQAPHAITHVGKRLSLTTLPSKAYGEMVARATTIIFDRGDVFIAYSAGDQSVRTLRMPLESFEAEYFSETRSFVESTAGASFLSGAKAIIVDSEFAGAEGAGVESLCADPDFVNLCGDSLGSSVCRSCPQ